MPKSRPPRSRCDRVGIRLCSHLNAFDPSLSFPILLQMTAFLKDLAPRPKNQTFWFLSNSDRPSPLHLVLLYASTRTTKRKLNSDHDIPCSVEVLLIHRPQIIILKPQAHYLRLSKESTDRKHTNFKPSELLEFTTSHLRFDQNWFKHLSFYLGGMFTSPSKLLSAWNRNQVRSNIPHTSKPGHLIRSTWQFIYTRNSTWGNCRIA